VSGLPPIGSGIPTLTGRKRIAVALTIGKKSDRGQPTEKDRFHILEGDAEDKEYKRNDGGAYKAPTRAPHPEFTEFNKAGAAFRRSIPVVLQHLTIRELWEYRYDCASNPISLQRGIPSHPKKASCCRGNGEIADRWDGSGWKRIPCPGEACPLRQPGPPFNGRPQKSPCGPWMRFLGAFDWRRDGKPVPDYGFKFTSGAWGTISHFKGFADDFNTICIGFGVDPLDVPLFGMPVRLRMWEDTNRASQSRFPVASIAYEGNDRFPTMPTWILGQLNFREEIKARARLAPPMPALTDASQQTPEILSADGDLISAGPVSVPARA
jgi:hypothetical protein